jgi:F420-dependent oxidoreductase-like protein
VRIGLMIGSDRDRHRNQRLGRLVEGVQRAERQGFKSYWMPQVPGYVDALTALALMGHATESIELGTAVVPVQTRHPMIMAQQVLTTQAASQGRFTLGIGASHHWIVDDQLGLPYERPATLVRDYLSVLLRALSGPGRVDVENELFRVHSPIDVVDDLPTPVVIAALGPVMLRLAGERAAGTILWMADERAIAEHVAPSITKAAQAAGRPPPRIVAGVPVALCPQSGVDAARHHANELLGHAEVSPNYLRLLEHGDALDVGDVMAAGDESSVEARLLRFRDAGVTDLAARVIPLGPDRTERIESLQRTQAFLASLGPDL